MISNLDESIRSQDLICDLIVDGCRRYDLDVYID